MTSLYEICMQFKDIGLIEKIKARDTKRLVKWVINRLESRRERGNLIEMYKSVNEPDDIN